MNYNDLSIAELREIAKEKELKKRSRMVLVAPPGRGSPPDSITVAKRSRFVPLGMVEFLGASSFNRQSAD